MPYNTACYYRMGLKAEQLRDGTVLRIGGGKLMKKDVVTVVNVHGSPNGFIKFRARLKGQFWKAAFNVAEDELLLEQGVKPDPHEELRKLLGITTDQKFVDEEHPWAV